jgi:dihydrodipicolinate synthase/N-acetylneuraminate lyase
MHLQGGIIPPLATPLREQDHLDEAGLERLIEDVIGGGVDGLFVLGSTGEGPSLSKRLRGEVVRASLKMAAGRVPVLAGVADPSYQESLGLARVAAEGGAAAVVISPPFYFTYSQEELFRYFERFSTASPLPVFLYNIPHLTKVRIGAETAARCAELPGVVGLKDSSFDLIYLAEVVRRTRRRADFQVYCGPEELLLPAMMLGASGGVCGGANYNPGMFVRLYGAIKRGDFVEARRLQESVQEIAKALYSVGDPGSSYVRGMKATLGCLGICSELPAWPLLPFSGEERELFLDRMAEARKWMAEA